MVARARDIVNEDEHITIAPLGHNMKNNNAHMKSIQNQSNC